MSTRRYAAHMQKCKDARLTKNTNPKWLNKQSAKVGITRPAGKENDKRAFTLIVDYFITHPSRELPPHLAAIQGGGK